MSSQRKINHPLFKVHSKGTENEWAKKSRSVKRTKIHNNCTGTNSWSKKYCHHVFRQRTKVAMLNDDLLPIKLDEGISEWSFKGDGKRYFKDLELCYLRK
jgi:hypothetical protein